VVRKDDPIKSAGELDGKEVAFPAPNAFGASLWIRALLAEREKIRIVPAYVKTHSNASFRRRGRQDAGLRWRQSRWRMSPRPCVRPCAAA
jgi:hypothetical protein